MGSPFPEGLRVLVVDDDATCLKVVGRMLQHCKYTVTLCNQPRDALNLLRGKRGSFDLVISDVRMPGMDGFKLLEHIELELDLPVIMMSADGEKDTVMKSLTQGACFYLVKPVKMDQLIGIWQYVIKRRQERMKDIEQAGSVEDNEQQRNAAPREEEEVAQNKAVEEDECAASANEGNWKKTKKRKKVMQDHVGGGEENDDASMHKKPRVLWGTELHDQFIIAVNRIGIDRAVPKKILEFMKVPGLSRENVASHLQKYRLYLKRVEEANLCAAVGTKPQNRVPMKSIFGSVPSQVMFHTRQHSPVLPQFTTQLGPSAFGLQPYKAMGTPRPSMNHHHHHLLTNSLPRLRYDQNQLLNNQVMANSISNSRSPLASRSFMPVNSFNNHTRVGFQQQPLPSTGNCSLGMLNNIGTATLGHNQMFQSFGNAGLPTNTATGMGMVGNSRNNGSTGAQFPDVGADGRGVPLPEFSASDYINGIGEMDAPEVLPDGTHGLRTFTDLIQSDNDDANNDHLKFGEESLSDVLTGFIPFTGTGDLEDIFKQRQDENNGNVEEEEFQYR